MMRTYTTQGRKVNVDIHVEERIAITWKQGVSGASSLCFKERSRVDLPPICSCSYQRPC